MYTYCADLWLTHSGVATFFFQVGIPYVFFLWTITHCLGLGHETMVCAVCVSMFLWICDMAGLLRGTFVSWWYLPRIWPSVTDMQHYYHARYPTDDWHLAYMLSPNKEDLFVNDQRLTRIKLEWRELDFYVGLSCLPLYMTYSTKLCNWT